MAKKMYVSNLRKKIILAAVIVFSVLCLSEYVLAQPPDTTEKITPTTKKQYTLPTITVTADKREIDVQKLPMSVQVITDQQLEDSSMKTIGDVLQHILYPKKAIYFTFEIVLNSSIIDSTISRITSVCFECPAVQLIDLNK